MQQNRRKPGRRLILKSILVHQIQALAVELKQTPTHKDIRAASRMKKCASIPTVIKLFGSVTKALEAARLPLRRNQKFTEGELIEQLRDLSRALGRSLRPKDVTAAGKAGTCARLAMFVRVFGTSGKAFRRAGVSRFGRFTRDDVIARYRELAKELGRIPTTADVAQAAREGKCAGLDWVQKGFAGITKLQQAAGLQRSRYRYTRKQLLGQLQELSSKLRRSPKSRDTDEAYARGECASVATFQNHFGSWNKALREAGLEVTKAGRYTQAQLVRSLQDLARRLGHRPSARDLDRASARRESPGATTYAVHFGGMREALKAAGIDSMRARIAKRSKR